MDHHKSAKESVTPSDFAIADLSLPYVGPSSYKEPFYQKLDIEIFKLELDTPTRPGAWYLPGENVTGRLILKNLKPITCSGIRVALEGTTVVHYLSGNLIQNNTENLLPYDWATVFFIGSSHTGRKRECMIESSRHEFPFTIPIRKFNPFPGTFSSSSGEIYYSIVAYIDLVSSVQLPKTVAEIIKIQTFMNLSTIPWLVKPVAFNGRQKICDGLKFSIHLPRLGFLKQEQIPFKLKLNNCSGGRYARNYRVCVSLLRKITYRCEETSKINKIVLSSCKKSDWEFFDGEIVEWEDSVSIPGDLQHPTIFVGIISCLYFLGLDVKADGHTFPTAGKVPITIGTDREIPSRLPPE